MCARMRRLRPCKPASRRVACRLSSYCLQSTGLEHGPFAFWLIEALRPRVPMEQGMQPGCSYFVQAVTSASSRAAVT
jgi:hypothetical protein